MGKSVRTWLLPFVGVGATLAAREGIARARETDLRGQVALVTGGSRGLGFLIARELVREGCRVAICARDEAELADAQRDLQAEGGEVLGLRCDVSERHEVEQTLRQIEQQLGPLDILVNNAGIIEVGPVQTMRIEDFERCLAVMYWGTVYPSLAVLPQMLERRQGRIVNITSIGGKVSVPHLLPYSSAKFAAVGFSEGLAAELAGTGVSVTTIAPGLMRTGSHLNAEFKGQRGREFTWFSLGATLPVISMDAERAARQIVQAAKRGERERVLSVPATVLSSVRGLLPGTTVEILGLVNRFVLPSAAIGESTSERGAAVQAGSPSSLRDRLTTWGGSAAERFQ
jgi:NAD(P)-dependent dehydrogenase (short-subunit alcohol dehydrogenase family)